ncbi:hypothetical protein C8J56DRAFT_905049 [Mycena floridula]|nr:hypothetical protein C8J56DRAFT_905049 [Mycena floridula]
MLPILSLPLPLASSVGILLQLALLVEALYNSVHEQRERLALGILDFGTREDMASGWEIDILEGINLDCVGETKPNSFGSGFAGGVYAMQFDTLEIIIYLVLESTAFTPQQIVINISLCGRNPVPRCVPNSESQLVDPKHRGQRNTVVSPRQTP